MKSCSLLPVFILITVASYGQSSDTWYSFWNRDSTLKGFKDEKGVVRITPRFMGFTIAKRFDNIIAVDETINGERLEYYLTKDGRIVGRDSFYVFDFEADCESEGFIRFRNNKNDKVGMFNRNGKVVIPAVYDELSQTINGLVIALKGAVKKQMGEHDSWQGGTTFLVDTSNRVVASDFDDYYSLNFYSKEIASISNPDTIRRSYKTVSNEFISFIDYEKEFKAWLNFFLSQPLTKENVLHSSFNEITSWKDPEGWVSEPAADFLARNFEIIKDKLESLKSPSCDYFICFEDLNPLIYQTKQNSIFFNNCGDTNNQKYPLLEIVISRIKGKNILQDILDFLRTNNGYRLISATIRNGDLK